MAYVLSHWRGAHSLLRSFWLNGVCLRMVIYTFLMLLTGAGPLPVALVVAVVGADLLVLIWQCIGYFRAAEHNLRGLGSMLPLWGGMAALNVAVFVVLSQWWGLALATYVPPEEELFTVKMDRLHASHYDMHVSDDRQVLTFRGIITLGATKRLTALLVEHPELRHVHLTSQGGNIYEARGMAKQIIARGLDTHVPADCSSACTLLFIAGEDRSLAEAAQLGFHGYALSGGPRLPHIDINAEQDRDLDFFRNRGVADQFLDRMFEQSHSSIWVPDRSDLKASGVVTAPAS